MKRTISILAALAAMFLTFSPASAVTYTNDGRFIDHDGGGISAPMGHRQYTRHGRSRVASRGAKSTRTAHRPAPAKQAHRGASVGQPAKAPATDNSVAPQHKQTEEAKRPAEKAADLGIPTTRGGMVRVQTAYGFWITVHPAYASKFLKFFAMLKAAGHKVNPAIVGCYSGGHKPGSNHHIGAACDIQTGWNRGPAFVYHVDHLARAAGLHSGCSFGDCGHYEAVRGLYNKSPNLYASLQKYKTERDRMRVTEAAP